MTSSSFPGLKSLLRSLLPFRLAPASASLESFARCGLFFATLRIIARLLSPAQGSSSLVLSEYHGLPHALKSFTNSLATLR